MLALLGYFLALCDLFFSQDLLLWLYVGAVVVAAHRDARPLSSRRAAAGRYRRSPVLALTLLAQALPIVVLLFLFFPRIYGGFRFQFSQSLLGTGGMSDRLSPGSVASLALSDEIVFRADFPDGNAPPMSQMYWRGGVLWRGDGLTWVAGPPLEPGAARSAISAAPASASASASSRTARAGSSRSTARASDVRGASFQPGGYLQSRRAITSQLQLRGRLAPREPRSSRCLPDQRAEPSRPPRVVSPRVQALVDGWRSAASANPARSDRGRALLFPRGTLHLHAAARHLSGRHCAR